jgi:DNA replication protein DnaC
MGFVTLDVPLGHPDFGRAIPCHCQQGGIAQRKQRRLQRLSNLDGLQNTTFDTFIPQPAHLTHDQAHSLNSAFKSCQYFAQEPDGWLLIMGTYGCGKTHLAAAIANARLAAGHTVLFQVVPDLLDHLRATFGPHSDISYDELFEQVRSTPLLVLDDLGSQSSSSWAQEKLFQLLNHRYNLRLPTVITTNQRLDTLEPRLRSRLLDAQLVTQVLISAPDFRSGGNPSQSDLSTLHLHRDQRFDNFDLNRSDLTAQEQVGLKDVFRVCRAFAEQPHGWLVLAGDYGCGKTHLAAAIANEQSSGPVENAMFIVVPDLLDHLRATFGPNSPTPYDRRFDEIKNTPLLILDDLGTESATPWAREKLFQLLNHRYNALLPTVITTSATPDELDPRLRTRMFDVNRCRFCVIQAPGYRGSRSQQDAANRKRRNG